jgi:signal transduction histidine kinase
MIPDKLTSEQLDVLLEARTEPSYKTTGVLDSSIIMLLDSVDRKYLTQLITEHYYEPGEVLIQEGDEGDVAYLIWSGRVVVYKGELESPSVIGYRGAGEIIGEMALLENRPRSATVVALNNLRLLRITRVDFLKILQSSPGIGVNIMEVLSARLRAANRSRVRSELSEKDLLEQIAVMQIANQQLLERQQHSRESTDFIVHDMRSPLGSVSIALRMLELVLPEEILQENRQLLDIAHMGCENMKRLLDTILDVSLMEEGQSQLDKAEFDIRDLIEQILSGYLVAQERNINLEQYLPDQIPSIYGDRDKLARVLANLLDNALKYTPDGGQIIVTVEVGEDQVMVSVADTGPGVPPEERDRVFDRYTQVREEKHSRQGYGLGLAYCRYTVETHGGRIWVESGENGKGAVFSFSLPIWGGE